MIEVNDNDFEESIIESEDFSLVIFTGNSCSGCHSLLKDMKKFEGIYDAVFATYNLNDNDRMAREYNIMSLPTMIVFKCGVPAGQMTGYRGEDEVKEFLNGCFSKI